MDKREFDEKLILEVEANPVLYQKTSKVYSNRYKKEEAWLNISKILKTDANLCKTRWKNLKDTFSKYYKLQKHTPSGSAANNVSWTYFEAMSFLIPYIEVPRTVSNYKISEEKENESEAGAVLFSELDEFLDLTLLENLPF